MANICITVNCNDGAITFKENNGGIIIHSEDHDGDETVILINEDEANEMIKVLNCLCLRMNPGFNITGTQRDLSNELNIRYC